MKIFLSSGESSGDMHAAKLMKELKLLDPTIEFIGIGGKAMINEGLHSLVDIKDISVVGFWEVAKKAKLFTDLLKKCKEIIINEKIDLFIPIDYPGFNIKIAAFCKSYSIPVAYYIVPQLWAWGKNRADKLKGIVDKLLVVFPFEVDFFKSHGLNAEFVGHPLLECDQFSESIKSFDQRKQILSLFPGSRKQEIKKHIPFLVDSAKLILSKHKQLEVCIAKAPLIDEEEIRHLVGNRIDYTISTDSHALMAESLVGIVKTGTTTLEAVLSGMPYAMYYITSYISYIMSKRLINLPYISLPNILLNRFVINEFIQGDAKPSIISQEISNIISDRKLYDRIQDDFLTIKNMLGNEKASKNAARIILSM